MSALLAEKLCSLRSAHYVFTLVASALQILTFFWKTARFMKHNAIVAMAHGLRDVEDGLVFQ